MENFKNIVERYSEFSIKLLSRRYIVTHLDRLKALLHYEDAVASRLDRRAYDAYLDEAEQDWEEESHMGCCVVHKQDEAEKPVAIAIATKEAYRSNVRRPTELNWAKTNEYREMEEQWCLDYLLRARECRGSGVGCFALVGLLECFCSRLDDGMLWLMLAGGFSNRNALSLYTDVGFLVTSLDSDKNPIMSLQVQDIGLRARRKLMDTLTLRHGAAAGEQGGGVDGQGQGGDAAGGGDGGGADGGDDGGADGGGSDAGGGDGGGAGDDGAGGGAAGDVGAGGGGDGGADDGRPHNLRRRRRRRLRIDGRREQRQPRVNVLDLDVLRFRTIEQQFTIVNGQLVLPPYSEGLEEDMLRRLWSMSDRAALHPSSQSFLIHLNVAKQCHYIASQRRLHVSRWIAEQRQENRENQEWNRRFAGSLANDVLLLWNVFRMPCLALLEIGYASACRPGGLKDIVRLCEDRVTRGHPLSPSILNAQQELHKYSIRMETSFPEDRIGDGDGLNGLRVISVADGWLDNGDVLVDDQSLSSLLWRNIEQKLGRRQDLPGTRQRCRIVAFDTQEVCGEVACHQHFAQQGRQWLEARMARLRQENVQVDEEVEETPALIIDVFDIDQYGRLLADVRGVRVGETTTILRRWTFARECVGAGWAFTTPFHIVPNCVELALQEARRDRVGAWGLQTDERPFQAPYLCRRVHREQAHREGRRREFWMPH